MSRITAHPAAPCIDVAPSDRTSPDRTTSDRTTSDRTTGHLITNGLITDDLAACADHAFEGENLVAVLGARTAVVTTAHRGTPVGVLLSTLAPVSPAAGVFSFSLSGYSYAWPALEKSTLIGVHLLDPRHGAEADLIERFGETRVDGFRPDVAWSMTADGVPLLEGCTHRTVARPTQRIHVGSHVLVVAQALRGVHSVESAA
jgi:flavin reductase (DIM6/NTAB) family NADH-FMN oxidoreductase RutF